MTAPIPLDWMDKVSALWRLDDGRGGLVRSYHIFDQDFPESVGEEDVPIALSFLDGVRDGKFSRSGPRRDTWVGWTEFYLTRNLDKTGLAYLRGWNRKVRNAVAANMKLSGTVDLFGLDQGSGLEIELPAVLKYGKTMHYGLVVHWFAIDQVSDELTTVGDPSIT